MPRPSQKAERTEEILDACERCLPRYGLAGTTLERVADEAGVQRPIIRHYIGNRDALLGALVKRYLERSRESLDELVSALPNANRARTAIDWLFDPRYSDAQSVQVASALIQAASEDRKLAKKMKAWVVDFVARLEQILAEDFPAAHPDSVSAVAAGISGIYFNVESLYVLGDVRDLANASKTAALMLLEVLEK